MTKKPDFLKGTNLDSAIAFFGVVLLYTLVLGVDIGVKEIILVLAFTIIFFLVNGYQMSQSAKK